MIKVNKRDRESGEKLLKRFSSHVKSRRLPQKHNALRNWKQKPTKGKVRQAAISREGYRKIASKKRFLN